MSRTWFVVHPRGLVVKKDEPGAAVGDEDARALGVALETAHQAGEVHGVRAMAASIAQDTPLPDGLVVRSLRELFMAVDAETLAAAGRATQIAEWESTSRFCGRCGTATERVLTERSMRCPKCGLLAYPRIAPAVIVLVRRGEEALLARNARFPLPFFSTLAGFAEIGETLEETVAREIREEVGIEVKDLRYVGSQPWPFPHSLMVGFVAEWAGGEVRLDENEIAEARWCRADALPLIPPPVSIARRMIDAWVDEVGGRARR